MEKKGVVFRVLVVVLAMLQPIVIVWLYGIHFPSISSTWDTMLQPLFIITNAVTSFFFFRIIFLYTCLDYLYGYCLGYFGLRCSMCMYYVRIICISYCIDID